MNKKLLVMTMCTALGWLPLSAQVTIEGSDTEYGSLYEAAQAAPTNSTIIVSGEVPAVSESITTDVKSVVLVGNKTLTINGQNNAVVKYNDVYVINMQDENGQLTVNDITFENTNTNKATTRNTFAIGKCTKINLNNVTIKNAMVDHVSGIIALTGNDDRISDAVLSNVKLENCTLTQAPADVVIGNNNVSLNGDTQLSIRLNGKTSIKSAAGFTGHVTLVLDADRALNSVVVKECQDITHFTLSGREGCSLQAKDGNLILVETPAIYNEVTGAGFTSLNNAISNSESGSTLILSQDITLQSRPDVGAKSLTIKGATNGVKIIRGDNFSVDRYLFLLNNAAGDLTLENLTIDGGNIATTAALIQPDKGAKLTMKNVSVINCDATTARGLIDNNGNGSWHLDGVSFENCMVKRPVATNDDSTEDVDINTTSEPYVSANSEGNSITGNNNMTLLISGDYSIVAQGVSNEIPVDVTLSSPKEGFTYFANCSDPNKFNCTNSGFKFVADGESLKLGKDVGSGIENIDAENDAEAVWYNLNGVRVNPNTPGLYIKVQGEKASKIYVK